jgi:hypothetical protein
MFGLPLAMLLTVASRFLFDGSIADGSTMRQSMMYACIVWLMVSFSFLT